MRTGELQGMRTGEVAADIAGLVPSGLVKRAMLEAFLHHRMPTQRALQIIREVYHCRNRCTLRPATAAIAMDCRVS